MQDKLGQDTWPAIPASAPAFRNGPMYRHPPDYAGGPLEEAVKAQDAGDHQPYNEPT